MKILIIGEGNRHLGEEVAMALRDKFAGTVICHVEEPGSGIGCIGGIGHVGEHLDIIIHEPGREYHRGDADIIIGERGHEELERVLRVLTVNDEPPRLDASILKMLTEGFEPVKCNRNWKEDLGGKAGYKARKEFWNR